MHGEKLAGLSAVSEYWDRYAKSLDVPGVEWGSGEFVRAIKEDHDKAFAYSNELLNIPALRDKSVLEILCGIGVDAVELARNGAVMTFTSPSKVCMEVTGRYFQENGLPVALDMLRSEALPFATNSFDLVLARGILMFVPNPATLVKEIWRVLKPGGEVYAHLHNKTSWYVWLARLSGRSLVGELGDPPVNLLHSAREANDLFKQYRERRIVLDRLPYETKRDGGVVGKLYNKVFVPATKLVPKRLMSRVGYYIIVRATK